MLILALDVEPEKARGTAKKFFSYLKFFKIGSRLFTALGPEFVLWLNRQNKKVFLDLKFHDIPNTVAEAVRNAVRMKVWGLTVHALGGFAMMKEAVKAAKEEAGKEKTTKPYIFAVTLLTSLDGKELRRVGIFDAPEKEVKRLALLAKKAGLDGVVASGREIKSIRKACGKNFLIAVPGIRMEKATKEDQKRTVSPPQAIHAGADYLILGRPLLQAKAPLEVVKNFLERE